MMSFLLYFFCFNISKRNLIILFINNNNSSSNPIKMPKIIPCSKQIMNVIKTIGMQPIMIDIVLKIKDISEHFIYIDMKRDDK